MDLILALSYGGRQEIVDAVRSISESVKSGKLLPRDIDEEVVSRHLYMPDIADPDLLIRTSGEQRISNFLLWQVSYCEFYITEKLWPDFTKQDLIEAIESYQSRQRRFGKTESLR
jgi:undecaprenyl diphosphate synthase